jgi:signal transduction histidine kinase
VIVHRQLKVLDSAERTVDDPDQLQTLFQLDHLATRSRRNAENLIILAGEQPGRQWRNPISLHDIVRGAIAETELYTRVTSGKIPDVSIVGSAVADVVHLLAELVDNGTAYSPDESTVEVRGLVVPRGVLIEVEDRGPGMDPSLLSEINTMLRNPPDFDAMAMSTGSHVGLFVVSRIAARHDITVSLRDSDHGGVRAAVLIPGALVAATESVVPQQDGGAPTDVRRSERLRANMSAFQRGTRKARTSGSTREG